MGARLDTTVARAGARSALPSSAAPSLGSSSALTVADTTCARVPDRYIFCGVRP